jgi:hypothetical protein
MSKPDTPVIWDRLIMTFPLSGIEEAGERIFIRETADPHVTIEKKFIRMNDRSDMEWRHDTLEDAVRVALSNSGWGTFRIVDITNV